MRQVVVALFVFVVGLAPEVHAADVKMAVLEFTSKGGVSDDQMDSLSDLLADEIRTLGNYRVIGKDDIRSLIKLEEKKAFLGCDDTSCLAEVGGALGVRWVVLGNVSQFEEMLLLNVKIIDSTKVHIVASVSKQVHGGQAKLVGELQAVVRELLIKARPAMHPDLPPVIMAQPISPFVKWGHVAFWSGLGVAVFGGVAIGLAEAASDDWEATGVSSAADRHRAWNGVSYTSFGVGGALMITGALLWILDPGVEKKKLFVSGGPTRYGQGCALMLGGRW